MFNNKEALNKQPPAFRLACFTAVFERFGFYALNLLLVLYAEAQFKLNDTQAFILFGIFNGLVFLTPTIGGYVADNFFGIRRSIILGLILEGCGLFLAAIPNKMAFSFALSLIVLGVGFFKTAPTNLLGRSYKTKDPRIDRGFTLFYMSMNVGGLLGTIAIGVLQKDFGWSAAFIVGGIALFFSLFLYFLFRQSIAKIDTLPGYRKFSLANWSLLSVGLLVVSLICVFLLNKILFANFFFVVVTLAILGYFGYEMLRSNHEDRLRIMACVVLIFIGFVYFVLYNQGFTSMELFIHRSVNHHALGLTIPTVAFVGLNPVWAIILGPTLAWIYKTIIRYRGRDLAVTTKFPIGLIAVSLGFLLMVVATRFPEAHGKIAAWWMLGVFGFYTLGEMLISALGVAMVTHIAPKRMYGVTMGAWFLGMSLSSPVAGWVANFTNASGVTSAHRFLDIYGSGFLKMGLAGLVCAVLTFLVAPSIKRIAQLD